MTEEETPEYVSVITRHINSTRKHSSNVPKYISLYDGLSLMCDDDVLDILTNACSIYRQDWQVDGKQMHRYMMWFDLTSYDMFVGVIREDICGKDIQAALDTYAALNQPKIVEWYLDSKFS